MEDPSESSFNGSPLDSHNWTESSVYGTLNDTGNTTQIAESTLNLHDLEAVKDPIQSVIAWMFYLTAFFSLIFNISAIVLIVSQFRRRKTKSRITLSHSPSHKAHNTNLTGTTLVATPSTTVHNHYHNYHKASTHKVRSGSSQLRIYLLNLFFNDIMIALFTTPFAYTDFMYGQWKYPAFLCPVTSFITTCAVAVSIYTLIAIGLERYFAIICPFKKLVPFERHTKWIIALIWTIGIIIAIPTLFMVRAVPFKFGDHDLLDCRELWEGQQGGKIYTYVIFSCTFLVPFIALTYLYVSIAIKAFRHVIPGNADASRDQLQLRNKIRMVKMLVFLVITFAVCWLPIQTLNLVMWICDSCRNSFNTPLLRLMYYIISFGCQWLSIAHSLLDPIIYCFNSRNFKISEICDELGSLGKWLFCCLGGDRRSGDHYAHNEFASTASFSDNDPRRLSHASISSSLPSSGRNSVAIHSPSFSTKSGSNGRKHHSLSAVPNSPGPLLGSSHSCNFNLSAGPVRHHSVSLGTPRTQFRASLERQQARGAADFIKEESESNAENSAELSVFVDCPNASVHLKCLPISNSSCLVTSSSSSQLSRLQGLPSNGTCMSHQFKVPTSRRTQQTVAHDSVATSQRVKRHSILSIVTRLVRRGPGKKLTKSTTDQNGGNQNWPDVASI